MGYDEPRSLGDRESGGGLALPIWIDYMAAALQGRAGGAAERRPGSCRAGATRVYAELANGGWIERISADTGVTRARPPDLATDGRRRRS